MATNADLSPDEKRFLVSLVEEGIELWLPTVYTRGLHGETGVEIRYKGRVGGILNGDVIAFKLEGKKLVHSMPFSDDRTAVRIGLSDLGKLRAEELKAEGIKPLSLPPTLS